MNNDRINPSVAIWQRTLDRRQFIKLLTAGSALIAATPIIGACGQAGGSSEDVRTVRVGLTPFQDIYTVMVGEEKGYWDEVGLRLEITNVAFEDVTESLASGAVDIGANNDAFVLGAQEKYPQQVQTNIFFLFQGAALMVRPDGPFRTFEEFVADGMNREEAAREACAQLKDKTILVTSNSDMELSAAAAAKQGGIDYFSDVEAIDANPDEGLALFLRGEADAYIGGLPQRTRLIKEGMVPLVTAKELSSEATIQGGWSSSEKLVKEEPDLFARFQRGLYRSLQFISKNPEEGFGIIIDRLSGVTGAEYTQEDLRRVWNNLELFPPDGEDMEKKVFSTDSQFYWRPRYEFVQDFYLQRDVLKSPVDLDRIYPFQWLHAEYMRTYEPKAWKELGKKHPSGDLVKEP